MKLNRISAVGVTLFLGLGIAVAAQGCTASADVSAGVGVPPGCNSDSSLDCSGGGEGISCPSGTAPNPSAGVCSDPSDQGDGTDGYCCIPFSGDSACSVDDTVTGCEYPSYGFSCTDASTSPDQGDSSLVCSQGVSDPNGNTDYCCVDGTSSSGSGSGSGGGGCSDDGSLSCDAGSSGVSCPTGTTPDSGTYGICSDPSDQGDGTDGFCCVDQTFTDCQEDDTVTATCDYPSFGFTCSGGSPDPSTDDPSLTCSQPTTDPNTGNDLYCCQ